jgi:hypothetical protein
MQKKCRKKSLPKNGKEFVNLSLLKIDNKIE